MNPLGPGLEPIEEGIHPAPPCGKLDFYRTTHPTENRRKSTNFSRRGEGLPNHHVDVRYGGREQS